MKHRQNSATFVPSVCRNRSAQVTAENKRNGRCKKSCSTNGTLDEKVASRKSGSGKELTGVKESSSMIVTKEEYYKLTECIRNVNNEDEEKEAAVAAAKEMNDKLLEESKLRKEEFRRIDAMKPREKTGRLYEIEEEASKRVMYVLARAQGMRLEQEEEIQKCNRIILETKCRAIRDAQIAEKKLIERELAEEEKRLNDMMENERRWALKEELKKDEEEAMKRQKFAEILKEQITKNEEQRMIRFEIKQEESRLINLSNIAWQQEEISKLRNREAENSRMRRELAEGNEQLKHFKAMEEQENKIIDLRIQDYQRNKAEREARLAEEQRFEKQRKEQDKTKIAARAMENRDLQARIDEINAARVQEEVEREWRQREKEEAIKRAKVQQILLKEREDQINSKRIMQAIELERDRREFEKIVRVQKEAFCREKKELEKKQRQALIHRTEILKQVNEKERERIEIRKKMFEEGLVIRTEAEVHKKKLREAMERKCQEMRTNNVPEVYINEVKRMIENIH